MSRKYGSGLRFVLATIVVSSFVCGFAATRVSPPARRAAQDLGPLARPAGPFRLQERSGREVTDADLADRVAIASFIFTRCPLSCPRITGVMQELQGRLAGTGVQLVSFSVDPDHDTPEVLRTYADRFGASPDCWWFLTGPKSAIYEMIRDRFRLGVMESPGPVGDDTESILHSDRLALIDHGRIVGLFESDDRGALDALVLQARRRALPAWVKMFPTINAMLNGLSACLLFAGWLLIRRYRLAPGAMPDESMPGRAEPAGPWAHPLVKAHIACMVSAIGTSALFLACYLTYHYQAGSMPFPHGGGLRLGYWTILLSHTLLAVVSVPLILVTVRHAWRGRLDRHVTIASFTLPVWLYVAVTGVVIYLLLYHMPMPPSSGPAGM